MSRRKREDPIATLDAVTATGRGDAVACHGVSAVAVMVRINGLGTSATIKVQGSMQDGVSDDERWVTYATISATADGTHEVLVEDPAFYVCGNVTAYSSGGTISVDVCKIREA